MAENYREVARGVVEVQYWITEYDREDGTKTYEWRTSTGDESSELFDTLEEAEQDVRYAL